MTTKTVQSRVDENLKKQAEAVYNAMGMSIADAIRIFLQQSVNIGGLPFQPSLRKPSTEFKQAIQELDNKQGVKFDNASDFRKHWE